MKKPQIEINAIPAPKRIVEKFYKWIADLAQKEVSKQEPTKPN